MTKGSGKAKVPSDRLRKAVAAGSVERLFFVLKDWPIRELKALLRDVNAFYDLTMKRLDDKWQELVFRPEIFLSKKASEVVDAGRDHARRRLLSVCSEISSVALFYVGEKGKK